MINGKTISQLPGIQEKYFIFSKKLLIMLLQCKQLLVTVIVTVTVEVLPAIAFQHIHDFDYCKGEWVKVLYENEPHIGLILDVNTSDKLSRVKCLVSSQGKHWKLEFERNSVWYSEYAVLGRPDNDPTMDRRQVLCTNYKHLIHAYH